MNATRIIGVNGNAIDVVLSSGRSEVRCGVNHIIGLNIRKSNPKPGTSKAIPAIIRN